jgi:hypothetical protein
MHYVGTLASNGQVCFSYARAGAQARQHTCTTQSRCNDDAQQGRERGRRQEGERNWGKASRGGLRPARTIRSAGYRAAAQAIDAGLSASSPPAAVCWRPPRRVVTACSTSGLQEFDSSYSRNKPFTFTIGVGQVGKSGCSMALALWRARHAAPTRSPSLFPEIVLPPERRDGHARPKAKVLAKG